MIARLPLIPTIVVLLAVGAMIRLGVWQLDRMREKEDLLLRYAAARTMTADAPFPRNADAAGPVLYRRSRVDCRDVAGTTPKAGQNAKGETGLAHYASCRLAGGGTAEIVLGWSRDPAAVSWSGGSVRGVIAPGPRLVADPPLAGLEPNRIPDPSEVPNNHLAYAVQWFLFAAVAAVIYGLAVRKRLAGAGRGR